MDLIDPYLVYLGILSVIPSTCPLVYPVGDPLKGSFGVPLVSPIVLLEDLDTDL